MNTPIIPSTALFKLRSTRRLLVKEKKLLKIIALFTRKHISWTVGKVVGNKQRKLQLLISYNPLSVSDYNTVTRAALLAKQKYSSHL